MKKTIVIEGRAKINVYSDKKISRELPVFYNPVMELNRSLTIEVLKVFGKDAMQIALPMEASGVRAIRFIKELPKKMIKLLECNDHSPAAVKAMKENAKLNKVASRMKIYQKDANQFLLDGFGYDYIDVDPFGSPNFLLDSAMKRISRGGIIGVTATDAAALAGTFPRACKRKYDSTPMRNHMKHEVATRILIRKIQVVAAQYDKACTPLLSYAHEHYYRVFVKCEKSKTGTDSIMAQHGEISYCPAHGMHQEKTLCCSKVKHAGPLWKGALWHPDIKKLDDSKSLIETMKRELPDIVGFYDSHDLFRKSIPRTKDILSFLKKKGFKASETIFNEHSIKTNAPLKEIVKYLQRK